MDSADKYEKYDAALLGILNNEANLQSYLDVTFGFLYRK